MSVDTTSVRYHCPFCDYDAVSVDSVKSHVTQSESGKHKGINGYTMEHTIEARQDKSKLPMIQRIQEAADQFDEPLTKDNAEQVAEHAQESDDDFADVVNFNAVLYIWEEAGFETVYMSSISTSFDGLTDNYKEALRYAYHTDLNPHQMEGQGGIATGTANQAIDKYGYLLDDRLVPKAITENDPTEADEDVESTETEDVVEREYFPDFIQALDDAGVDFEVEATVHEDDFDVIQKLIEAGHSDVAEEHFYE